MLGAIPKPDFPEVCLVHDCSHPHGHGLNGYMTPCSFTFQILDDVIKLLQSNYFMAKVNLCYAYSSVLIHPSNFTATGLKWQFPSDTGFAYFYDTRLPFGLKSLPEISLCYFVIQLGR